MKMTADANTEIETCGSFRRAALQSHFCELCGHSWVLHALQRLAPRCVSGRGPVEVAVPGLVLDISSLVLFGAQAVPITLKILLDRLFSVLTPEQVGHILHTLGWCLGDYVRGYKLQDSRGRTLDHWLMASPLEERLILKQFLRFGETRPIVELMSLHSGDSSVKSLSSFQTTLHKDCAPDPTTLKPNVKPDPDKFIRPETKQDHSFPPPSPVCPFSFSSSTRSTPNSTPPLSSTFFCPPLAPAGSVLSMSHSGASFLSRKGRVSCGVCGKSFYDKGTLKIHYNAVHLKIKHRCTVSGCTMVFSSLRSRNRHSANPNPRLHTCSGNHDRDDGLFRKNQPNATDKTEDNKLWVREEQGKNQTPRREMSDATQVQFARDQSKNQRFNSIALLCTDRFDCANSCSIADIPFAKRKELNDPSQLQREVVPKKKSRKSSMPLKIERQTFEL